MAILPIQLYGADVLRRRAGELEEVDDAAIGTIRDMFETMHAANGIGLAANQVGLLRRIIVVDISAMEDGKGVLPLALINPVITEEGGSDAREEGCLSIPEVRDEVTRPASIHLRYRDTAFAEKELHAEGILARVIQHELDHLNGILFVDHLSAAKRTLLKPKLRRIRLGEIEVSYPVVVPGKASKRVSVSR